MALFLGSEKKKLNFNNALFNLNIYSSTLTVNGVMLLSHDNYILTDSNGLYLIVKEDE